MKVSKKITLFSLSLAGLALLAFPHSGKAFDLEEEWVIKGGVKYQDGKILRFNNGHEVDIKVLDLPKTEKIEWTVSLNGQDQTVNFLGQEKDKSMVGTKGRYLNFYVPYGYRGDIKVEAKSGNEVKTWSTKVVDDVYNGGKSGYYHIKELKNQIINTPTLILNGIIKPRPTLLPYQKLSMVKKSMLGQRSMVILNL